MKVTIFFLCLLIGSIVSAKPVYLNCSTTYKADPPIEFVVTIDEETGKITHKILNGLSFIADGHFTATQVSYKKGGCSSLCIIDQYTINRVNLAVTKTLLISRVNTEAKDPTVSNGTCSIQQVPERQF